MGDVHHCSRAPVSEMTYTVSSGTLNSTILLLLLLRAYACILCSLFSDWWRQCRGSRRPEKNNIAFLKTLSSFIFSFKKSLHTSACHYSISSISRYFDICLLTLFSVLSNDKTSPAIVAIWGGILLVLLLSANFCKFRILAINWVI